MNEIREHMLKCEIAYSDNTSNTLKNTLIPFIIFTNLISKESLDKILPYKQICLRN
jgi:hypothetical protein